METKHQFLMLTDSPAKEEGFQEAKRADHQYWFQLIHKDMVTQTPAQETHLAWLQRWEKKEEEERIIT